MKILDLDHIKNVAVKAAYSGAGAAKTHFGRLNGVRKKGAVDLVTEADVASEKAIVGVIREQYPAHALLAEESGCTAGDDDCQWIVDPLDGTTNFAHGLGVFSVSIAFARKGRVVVGVVLNPMAGELFSAVKEKGAALNGVSIRVSDSRQVEESLLATGFPYNLRQRFDPIANRFLNCLRRARGIRRLGSAALDLCYLACGRFDGFWEQHLHPWDTAAGALIAAEAGAVVTDFCNAPYEIDKKEILATNGGIHQEMLGLLSLKRLPGKP